MSWNRTTKFLSIALVVAVAGAVAVSQASKHHFGPHGDAGEHMLGFFTDYLDLTDAQQAQARQIMDAERPKLKPLMDQVAEGHRQMHALASTGKFDEAKVRALASQQAQAMTELMVQKARIHAQMVALLTPEQKTKLTKFMDRKEQHMREHMGMHEGMGGESEGPAQ
jgi:Spy/CpxP family protein refolding chaperone